MTQSMPFLKYLHIIAVNDTPEGQFAKKALAMPEITRKSSRKYVIWNRVFKDAGLGDLFEKVWYEYRETTRVMTHQDIRGITIFCKNLKKEVDIRSSKKSNILVHTNGFAVVLEFMCECGEKHAIDIPEWAPITPSNTYKEEIKHA